MVQNMGSLEIEAKLSTLYTADFVACINSLVIYNAVYLLVNYLLIKIEEVRTVSKQKF